MISICLTEAEFRNLKFDAVLFYENDDVIAQVRVAEDRLPWLPPEEGKDVSTVNVRVMRVYSKAQPTYDLISAQREQLFFRNSQESTS